MSVARRRFLHRDNMVILKIDATRVDVEIKYEGVSEGSEVFPHIYGPLNMDAVVEIEALSFRDGDFVSPQCLADTDVGS